MWLPVLNMSFPELLGLIQKFEWIHFLILGQFQMHLAALVPCSEPDCVLQWLPRLMGAVVFRANVLHRLKMNTILTEGWISKGFHSDLCPTVAVTCWPLSWTPFLSAHNTTLTSKWDNPAADTMNPTWKQRIMGILPPRPNPALPLVLHRFTLSVSLSSSLWTFSSFLSASVFLSSFILSSLWLCIRFSFLLHLSLQFLSICKPTKCSA